MDSAKGPRGIRKEYQIFATRYHLEEWIASNLMAARVCVLKDEEALRLPKMLHCDISLPADTDTDGIPSFENPSLARCDNRITLMTHRYGLMAALPQRLYAEGGAEECDVLPCEARADLAPITDVMQEHVSYLEKQWREQTAGLHDIRGVIYDIQCDIDLVRYPEQPVYTVVFKVAPVPYGCH